MLRDREAGHLARLEKDHMASPCLFTTQPARCNALTAWAPEITGSFGISDANLNLSDCYR